MNQTRCSYVDGYHCEYYNRGTCEYIAYCVYQDDDNLKEENRRLLERIKELEVENEKLKNEVKQTRASRDMWAEIPEHLRDDRVGPMIHAKDVLKHVYK